VDRIPKGDRFGPFEGTKIYNSKQALNPQYAWEVGGFDEESLTMLFIGECDHEGVVVVFSAGSEHGQAHLRIFCGFFAQ
jgi:hypothetical protein